MRCWSAEGLPPDVAPRCMHGHGVAFTMLCHGHGVRDLPLQQLGFAAEPILQGVGGPGHAAPCHADLGLRHRGLWLCTARWRRGGRRRRGRRVASERLWPFCFCRRRFEFGLFEFERQLHRPRPPATGSLPARRSSASRSRAAGQVRAREAAGGAWGIGQQLGKQAGEPTPPEGRTGTAGPAASPANPPSSASDARGPECTQRARAATTHNYWGGGTHTSFVHVLARP